MFSLSIVGTGMASNVGMTAPIACSSVRAGICILSELSDFTCYDPDDMEAPMRVASIPILSNGFVQNATWLSLAHVALQDLMENCDLPSADDGNFWRRTPLLWVLPELLFERFYWPEENISAILENACAAQLARNMGYPFFTPQNGFITIGSSGSAQALLAINDFLANSGYQRCIVLGVDSLIDQLCLTRLLDDERIKMPDSTTGLIPGENASCILIESTQSTNKSFYQGRILNAVIQATPLQPQDEHIEIAQIRMHTTEIGQSLSNAILQCVKSVMEQPFTGEIILDLNGESWRNQVWGVAQVMLQKWGIIDFEACCEVIPAESWGDIGAAYGVAAMCLATQGYVHQYPTGEHSLICSVSENGTVSVILLSSK